MIKKISGEVWKPLLFDGHKSLRYKYAISSLGRVASYSNDVHEDGKLLKGSVTSGYKTLNLHMDGMSNTLYIHREVGRIFLPKPGKKEKIVLHLNHDKSDNRAKNLKWANQETATEHQQKSPARLAFHERQRSRLQGFKLNASQVRAIKTQLANPKRKLTNRQVAEKYGVSEMTIYRILRGESWSRI